MIFYTPQYWEEKECKKLTLKCPHCHNTSAHFVVGILKGLSLGVIFLPQKYHLGIKQYGLMCPICHNISQLISKDKKDELKL